MAELNHFAISAGMGSTLGPRVAVHHGQMGSMELAATLAQLLGRREAYVDDVVRQDDLTRKYEKAVTRAFLMTRRDFSSDRVLADPEINADFVQACRDLGLSDTPFHLNLALIGLRKHNKLKVKSKKTVVRDQWRYAAGSEVAARTMFYRYRASVDTTLAHPAFAGEFDRIASTVAPGFLPFEYRWAALNVRKKGASAKIRPRDVDSLEWSGQIRFDAASGLPDDEGVYTLFEQERCLLVAGTEDIQESVTTQQGIAAVDLFEPDLWQPNSARLNWRYVRMPDTVSDYRFGVVRSLVGRWEPVFNIPRGTQAA